MIFDKNYDKTLRLLIGGDSKNREKIINFIESIPNEFLVKIQDTILEYNKYKLDGKDKDNMMFNGELYNSNGYLYSFNIDKNNDSLRISRNVCKYGLYFNDMDLVLSSYNSNDYSKKYIGSLIYDYDYVVTEKSVVLGDCTKIEYLLAKTLVGDYLLSSNKNLFFEIRVGVVNLDSLDKDYSIKDLEVNRLVRSKKKK